MPESAREWSRRSLVGAGLVVLAALARPSSAQVRDARGDTPFPCIDIVQTDVRADGRTLAVTLDLAAPACADAQYSLNIDTDLDGVEDFKVLASLGGGGELLGSGPEGVVAQFDDERRRVVWRVPLDRVGPPPRAQLRKVAAWFVASRGGERDRMPAEPGTLPLGVGGIASAVIGPEGGMVEVQGDTSNLRGASIVIAEGAVGVPTVVSLDEAPFAPDFPSGRAAISSIVAEPANLVLARPGILTLPYADSDLEVTTSLGEETLSVYRRSAGTKKWVGLGTRARDLEANRVSTSIVGLGHFALQDASVVRICEQFIPTLLPTLLVHGWQVGCGDGDSSTWGQLPFLLCNQGVDVFAMNYNTADPIPSHALALSSAIDVAVSATAQGGRAAAGVNLVAHSMGGLVARYAIERLSVPETRVFRLLTAGTPHLGANAPSTISCTVPIGCPAFQEMSACSPFLEGAGGLNPGVRPPGRPRDLLACRGDYAFYGANDDDIVTPASASGEQWAAGCNCGAAGGPAVFTFPAISPVDIVKGIVGTSDTGILLCGNYSRVATGGCGVWGNLACDHSSFAHQCDTGVVDIRTEHHVLWPKIRDLAHDAPWWAFPDDDFGDNCLNRRLWRLQDPPLGARPGVPCVTPGAQQALVCETNGRLEFTSMAPGPDGTGVLSTWTAEGDFDVRMDYSLLAWPARNTNTVQVRAVELGVGTVGGVAVGRHSPLFVGVCQANEEMYTFVFRDDFRYVCTRDMAGVLRLSRTGSVIAAFYSTNGVNWTQIGAGVSLSNPPSSAPTRISIEFGSSNPVSPAGVKAAVARFKLPLGTVH